MQSADQVRGLNKFANRREGRACMSVKRASRVGLQQQTIVYVKVEEND